MKTTNKRFLYAIASVFVGGLSFLGAKHLVSEGIPQAMQSLMPKAALEAKFDRSIEKNIAFTALSENFPHEWAEMRSEIVSDLNSNMSKEDIEGRAYARTRQFFLGNAAATSSAPTSALVQLYIAEGNFISALQHENVKYCADFGMRGLQPNTQLSPAIMEKVYASFRARVIATREGLDRPVQRSPIKENEWALVVSTMRANGISQSTLLALRDPSTASPSAVCEGTVQLYRAMNDLPPEVGAKIFSYLIKTSAEVSR